MNPECGAPNPLGRETCFSCGQPLRSESESAGSEAPEASEPAPFPIASPHPSRLKDRAALIAIGFGVVAVLLLPVVLLVGLTTPNTPATSPARPNPPGGSSATTSGIALATRKGIFYALTEAEVRAMRDADRRYPTAISAKTTTAEMQQIRQNVPLNAELSGELMSQYKATVRRRYRISEDQETAISVEGVANHWPMANYDPVTGQIGP